jgi:NAD(P)H dehydrogenase (quinone)
MKNILIINGHPDKESFCTELANSYKKGADQSSNLVKIIHLHNLEFSPNLKHGYRQRTELEPDLLTAQENIRNADHLVFVYPNWWGTYPALLKGFFDRVFIPGFAFKPHTNSVFWDKLLKNKSARIIVTMDSPKWYNFLIFRRPGHNSMKNSILQYCGVNPVKFSTFTPIKRSTELQRSKWLKEAEDLGKKLK